MIGDRNKDVEAAQFAGTHSLGVLWGFGSREELEAAGVMRIVDLPSTLGNAIHAFQ